MGISFVPTLEAPNRIPPGRFSLPLDQGDRFRSLGCRHGLVLISDRPRHQFVVWDPVTGEHQQLAMPPGFSEVKGAVLRDADGVHFKVVSVQIDGHGTPDGERAVACVYSSKTDWGFPLLLDCGLSSIFDFDLEKQSLAVIRGHLDVFYNELTVIRADGGGLGLLLLSDFTTQVWEMKTDCDGVASWVLGRTIELDKLLSVNSEKMRVSPRLVGFAEENNVVIIWTSMSLLEVQLQSLQFKILCEGIPEISFRTRYHPFESVYTAGIGGGHDAIDLLHNA